MLALMCMFCYAGAKWTPQPLHWSTECVYIYEWMNEWMKLAKGQAKLALYFSQNFQQIFAMIWIFEYNNHPLKCVDIPAQWGRDITFKKYLIKFLRINAKFDFFFWNFVTTNVAWPEGSLFFFIFCLWFLYNKKHDPHRLKQNMWNTNELLLN